LCPMQGRQGGRAIAMGIIIGVIIFAGLGILAVIITAIILVSIEDKAKRRAWDILADLNDGAHVTDNIKDEAALLVRKLRGSRDPEAVSLVSRLIAKALSGHD